jgi:broad specificity phosphatase PhoE
MRLYLLRHGESEANVGVFINDDPTRPVLLTAKGREQAATAAQALSCISFNHAYASQFPRAQQTAEIILAGRDLSLTVDARLNERRSGLDGQPVEAFNLETAVERARVCGFRVGWQGATTQRAGARKEEQRRQTARKPCNRARSGVT